MCIFLEEIDREFFPSWLEEKSRNGKNNLWNHIYIEFTVDHFHVHIVYITIERIKNTSGAKKETDSWHSVFSCSRNFAIFFRFTSVRTGQGMGLAEAGYDVGGGFMEEYLLEDLELAPADLGE